jgi:HlyD family secretion protein
VAIISVYWLWEFNKRRANSRQNRKEQIAIASKIPGKIAKIFVKEDFAKKGDTLAILDLPEVDAKIQQAEGAQLPRQAQYNMAVKGN